MTALHEHPEQTGEQLYDELNDTIGDDVVRVYRSDWSVADPSVRELSGVWLRTPENRWVREDALEMDPAAPPGARGLHRLQAHTFGALLAEHRTLHSSDVHDDTDFHGLDAGELAHTLRYAEDTLALGVAEADDHVDPNATEGEQWRREPGSLTPGQPMSAGCPWVPATTAVIGGPTHRLQDIDHVATILATALTRTRDALAATRAYATTRATARWHTDLADLATRADTAATAW